MTTRAQSNRKNIMREFTISELSAVDRPAQEHARMTIMKCADHQQEHQMQIVSFPTLEAAMDHLKRQGMSGADAMSKAARDNPALLARYQSGGVEKSETIMTVPPPVRAFERVIQSIKERDGCDSATAMRRARAENPDAFRAYQAA
jgi:hypothetical protein